MATFNQIGSTSAYKAGQKFPTPSPGNGDRVFYETLFRQRPDSEMAQEWCVSYGILDAKEAEILSKSVLKRKSKSVPEVSISKVEISSSGSSTTVVRKKLRTVSKIIDGNLNNDAGLDDASPWEGIGTTGI